MKRFFLISACAVMLAGCGGFDYSQSEFRSTRVGNTVRGTAGPGWDDFDLERNAHDALCHDNEFVAWIEIVRLEDGSSEFTALCTEV